ncbi:MULTISPECIES: LysR family transcriptional regulator [Pseudoalteromonas]|uniref:Transcriptional regulator n=1 Tax=Pseudoalteromonas luteoviolacea (strain 2ta16) TaxID=1353533 RepID=V4HY96_PSEL2|nr:MULTISPECIES: LysR family transcriptional regulator [Pseudoalteromonas]ESP92914.1 transcriptional regulator [Pseudoalteromonas luteoviolacea 2ta16]KZN35726.1 LysR family transcriptional regulator [Pseudoalteromonas luteoviolacea NCIMB 1944]MCG7546322.1 LysR family transcriptional regulator [Pseudoalteromonas sp. Of7M-16]
MDKELLKTFVEVSKTRHFGRAAENLYITQSAVSFRIRQLEQNLGVSLFTRQRNNIQLTAAGERLLPHAKMLLTAMQRARLDVALANNRQQQLSLAGTPNIWDAYLHFGINQVISSIPEVSLVAEVKAHQESVRLLLERTLDIAVLFDPPKVDELIVRQVKNLSIIPVSTFNYTNRDDFFGKQYVYVDWGTSFSLWHAKQCEGAGPPYFRTNTGRIALELILQCGGSAYLPKMLAADLIEEQKLFLVEAVSQSFREVFVAYHKGNEQLEHIETVVNLLASIAE